MFAVKDDAYKFCLTDHQDFSIGRFTGFTENQLAPVTSPAYCGRGSAY
jgi:hypothetical protein